MTGRAGVRAMSWSGPAWRRFGLFVLGACWAVAGLARPALAARTPLLYAAPAGAGRSCSQAHPCSIAVAVRAAQARAGGHTVWIVLAGGTYPISNSLRITVAGRLVLAAEHRGSTPVLDGHTRVQVMTVGSSSRVTLSGLEIESGYGRDAGGGIDNRGGLTVEHSVFSANSAELDGGGIFNSGTLTVENSVFSGNSVPLGSGGAIGNRGRLAVRNTEFFRNSALGSGGAIVNDGTLAVTYSTFSDNTARQYSGGAIRDNSGATVVGSTIASNTAAGGGGGIEVQNGGNLTVARSTISGNAAGDVGGGIGNYLSTLTVEASTIRGNSAANGGAGVGIAKPGTVTLAADIIATQASGSDCFSASGGGFVDAGYNLDADGTCVSASSPAAGSHSGPSAYGSSTYGAVLGSYLAGGLADNGGSTQTIALLNSPNPPSPEANPALAIVPASFDLPAPVHGVSAACSLPDQRGVVPTAGIDCDIGAYHLQATATTLAASTASAVPNAVVAYAATVTPTPVDGTISFDDGAGNPATTGCADRPLVEGTATCEVSYPTVGVYSVTASYSGDGVSNNDTVSTSGLLSLKVSSVPPPPAGLGYCSATGNTNPATGAAFPPGTFLQLVAGQPASDPHYTGAVPADYVEGIGVTCGVPHAYTATGLTVGQGGLGDPGVYPYYRKRGAPRAPTELTGLLFDGALVLSWHEARGSVPVVGYELVLNGRPVRTVPDTTGAEVRAFVPGGPSVFTVRALNAAGKTSAASDAVSVRPVPYPTSAPKLVPAWAWQLLAWEMSGSKGARPAGAPTSPPSWYTAWKAWRQAPFALAP